MSRLSDNSIKIKNNLEARNLYNPLNPYSIESSLLVKSVNTLASIVKPFSSFDLSNTVVGRLIGPQTPLAKIALVQLAKQFGQTAASNAAAEYLPAIKFENLFDGNPNTKFIMKKIDYQITRRESQSSIGRILEEVSGRYSRRTPFTKNPTNADIIRNTGKGQLQLFGLNLNRNIYKPTSKSFIAAYEGQGLKLLSGQELIASKTYFTNQDQEFYPFSRYQLQFSDIANSAMRQAETNFRSSTSGGGDSAKYLEYGATQTFVDNVGKTIIRNNNDGSGNYKFENFAENNYGLEDDASQQIVWGRDGASNQYVNDAQSLDNPFAGVDNQGNALINSRFDFANQADRFKINHGLLNYTKELLNSKGKYNMSDLTRKKFIDRDQQLHFNGIPLDIDNSGNLNKTRQHAVADPYDRFVKAIRFNGNKVYGGNQNSTIYESVMPKIHPILNKEGRIDNRNMMFSLENLAAVTIKDENNGVAYLDDNVGTELPIAEAGQLGGRVMWFPPYDIQLSEQAIARHESTSFIGRGEPIYTYNNSERIANLSFKLLVDYPPQVKGQNHVFNSRFFAFGGEAPSDTPTTNIGQKENDKKKLIDQRESIKETTKRADPQIKYPNPLAFYFPNDLPRTGSEVGSVQSVITSGYEISSANIDGRNTQLNTQFVNNIQNVFQTYFTPENRKFIKIQLLGSASELGPIRGSAAYNKALSERRIVAVKSYIDALYRATYGSKGLVEDGIKIETNPLGASGGTLTDEASEIPTDSAKQARRVQIRFVHNGVQETVVNPLTPSEIDAKNKLSEDIGNLEQEIVRQKILAANNKFYFNQYTIQDGVLKGFNAMDRGVNKYKPVFHSQTPEDFHRRLTFLQQCTRQGNAIRKVQKNDDGATSFSASNAVFGRQPVCILRIGDFFHTKVIIESINFDYNDSPWDMNPEGMGMQFMIANITMQMKVIGGQSLRGPIDVLQNAVSFNYYGNSTFYNDGVYKTATGVESAQYGVDDGTGNNPFTNAISDANRERVTQSNPAVANKLPQI